MRGLKAYHFRRMAYLKVWDSLLHFENNLLILTHCAGNCCFSMKKAFTFPYAALTQKQFLLL